MESIWMGITPDGTTTRILACDGPGLLNEHSRWSATVEQLSGSALFRVDFVSRVHRRRDGERVDGMGDYRDVRQLIIRGVAR